MIQTDDSGTPVTPALSAALDAALSCSRTYRARRVDADQATGDFHHLAADLVDPSTGAAREVIARQCEQRGLPYGRHGASLIFQRYSHRICGLGISAAVLTSGMPALNVTSTVMIIEKPNPSEILLLSDEMITDPSPGQIVQALVTNHLEPLAEAWTSVCRMSRRGLIGNIAASFGSAVRRLEPFIGTEAALAWGHRLAGTHPALGSLGNYLVLEHDGRNGLFYERRTCCQWYVIRDKYCSWCCHHDHEERLKLFRGQLTGTRDD